MDTSAPPGALRVQPNALASAALRPFVGAARASTSRVETIDRLPDGTTTLIFRLLDADRADLTVLGPQTRAVYKRASSGLFTVKLVFRPGGAYPFFGVPMDELADRVVPARDLWGRCADTLLDELVAFGARAAPDRMRARMDAMERALLARLRGPDVFEPASAAVARAAVARLAAEGGSVEEAARALDVSARNLRRAFTATVGVSPKRFARIARFQRALSHVLGPRGSWSAVALASGYCDQPHLVADFRELTGLAPVAFMNRRATSQLIRTSC